MSEIASILRTQRPRQLSADEEKLKRDLYEKISPRRRKFIDRIGYENWDPFPEPNEPNDIRTDVTKRTVHPYLCAGSKNRFQSDIPYLEWDAPEYVLFLQSCQQTFS